jgi:hypothetical protein
VIRGGIVGALLGAFTGTVGLVLVCAICLVVAFASHDVAEVPGVFRAWFATVDGIPQLRFLPDGAGMGLALVVWSAVAAGFGAASARSRPDLARDRPRRSVRDA